MTTTSKLRLLKTRLRSRKPKDTEWQRLAEMPEPARSSPHRPYWVCARFLCAMHAYSTCSPRFKKGPKLGGIHWCNKLIGLGVRALEQRGDAHFEVYELAFYFSDRAWPIEDLGMLATLRNDLVREERDRWDFLSDGARTVLEEIEAAGQAGLSPNELAVRLGGASGFKRLERPGPAGKPRGQVNRHGKGWIRELCQGQYIKPAGSARGRNVRYVFTRWPAGWPE